MKIRARSALPLLCLAIAACVSLPYRNPPGRDVAEIIFHNEADAVATAEIFGRAEACKKRRVTGPIAPGGAVSARLPAGRPVSFSLGYKGAGAGGPYCRVYATFSPALHAQYAAFIRPGGGLPPGAAPARRPGGGRGRAGRVPAARAGAASAHRVLEVLPLRAYSSRRSTLLPGCS